MKKHALSDRWKRQEPGWYTLGNSAAVCKEADGFWHAYVGRDSRHRTLREAMRAAERRARRPSHG